MAFERLFPKPEKGNETGPDQEKSALEPYARKPNMVGRAARAALLITEGIKMQKEGERDNDRT